MKFLFEGYAECNKKLSKHEVSIYEIRK